MTNSEVLQFIIGELHDSPLNYKGDKELFELIFDPIAYENETTNRRKITKQPILDIFQNYKEFDKSIFNKLANNIICGENEKTHREEVLDFVKNEIKRLDILTSIDTTKLIKNIPCKDGKENNYRSHFSYWKNNFTAIHDKSIKNALEKNFDFQNKLWSRGDALIKQALQKGIKNFIERHTRGSIDIFIEIRTEFDLKDDMTKEGSCDLETIKSMDKQEIKQYIKDHYPLSENRSQIFILELISILYVKGYYELLYPDIFEELDLHHRDNIKIKKIEAHVLGSSIIGEYKKAFDLLSTIPTEDNQEIVDMQTEAISNMRRYQLNDKKIDSSKKREIITKLISHYDKVFRHNGSYHYYPAINIAYTLVISSNLFEDEIEPNIDIEEIFSKAKNSIQIDKQSKDAINRYYANITSIEFMLLRNTGNPIAELERFLDLEEENVSLIELERTQRQMQFFVDSVGEGTIASNIQKTIELIDDFIDYRSQIGKE